MVVRKASKGKFWGCTKYRETGCNGSAEYNGSGACAGLHLNIREIENGLIITTSSPYGGVNDDPVDLYVKDYTDLSATLTGLIGPYVELLCKELENSTEFTDEIDTVKHASRVETAKRGTTDVSELLKRMAKAKGKGAAGEKAIAPEG